MKKLLALVLGALLVMLATTVAMGAIHDSFGDFVNPISQGGYDYKTGGGWFYIEQDDPYIQFNAASEKSNLWQVASEYWKNDQMFVEGTLLNGDLGDSANKASTSFRGSYLTDNCFIFGFEYNSLATTQTIFSPGFRFCLNENFYIAASVDYQIISFPNGGNTRDIAGYDVDYKLYGEKYKLYGQFYYVKPDKFTVVNVALNYKLADAFVIGGFYDAWARKVDDYGAGFTWSPESFLVDLKYTRFEDNSYKSNEYKLSGLYSINDKIGLGFDYAYLCGGNIDDSIYTGIKAKYKAFDGAFLLTYGTPTGKYEEDANVTLRFNKTLK